MKLLILISFLSLLFLDINSIPVPSRICPQIANEILSIFHNDFAEIMTKEDYEGILQEVARNPFYRVLNDREDLTEAVCKILNAESLMELSEIILNITNFGESSMQIATVINDYSKMFEMYLQNNFFKMIQKLKELLKKIQENIFDKKIEDNFELEKKYIELINEMSLKYGSSWASGKETFLLFSNIFQTVRIHGRLTDNITNAIRTAAAKYSNITSLETFNHIDILLVEAHKFVKFNSKNRIDKVIKFFENGFHIIEYFYQGGIFSLPVCSEEKIVDKFLALFNQDNKIIRDMIPPVVNSYMKGFLSNNKQFKIILCDLIHSSKKSEFNKKLAGVLRKPKNVIEMYENMMIPYLHPAEFYTKTIEIIESFFSFITNTRVLLEWPIKVDVTEIKQFLDGLSSTYGETWLRYIDPIFQLGISNYKMDKLMNSNLANSFIGATNDREFLINLGFSHSLYRTHTISEFRHFILSDLKSKYVKISKDLLSIYKDIDNAGIINLIKAPKKKCNPNKHKFLKDLLNFWEKNENILLNSLIPIFNEYFNIQMPVVFNFSNSISELLCELLESNEQDFGMNFSSYLGDHRNMFLYETILRTITKISRGDEDIAQSLNIWAAVLNGYEQLQKMKVDRENKRNMISFVEQQLKDITKMYGSNWTGKLTVTYNPEYKLQYHFQCYYNCRYMAENLVESDNAIQFSEKMKFSYNRRRTAQKIFYIIQMLIMDDWRKFVPILKEINNLIIEFGHTSLMKNFQKIFYLEL